MVIGIGTSVRVVSANILRLLCHNSAGNFRSHYEVLGVSATASAGEIRAAFLRRSKQYHPDSSRTGDTSAQFVELNEAYRVLARDDTRRQYDRRLQYGHFQGHRGWTPPTHMHPHAPHVRRGDGETHQQHNHWRQYEGKRVSNRVTRVFISIAVLVVSLRFFASYLMYRSDNRRMKSLAQAQRDYQLKKDTPEYIRLRQDIIKFSKSPEKPAPPKDS